MNNPHVIPGIDSHTCNCANEPVIRQRLRPEGINFEIRNLPRVLCHKDRRTCQQKYSELFHLSHNSRDSTPARKPDRVRSDSGSASIRRDVDWFLTTTDHMVLRSELS